MIGVCYSKYEVYLARGTCVKGGDAMKRTREGRWSEYAHRTASKEMYLCKPVL